MLKNDLQKYVNHNKHQIYNNYYKWLLKKSQVNIILIYKYTIYSYKQKKFTKNLS